MTDRKHDPLSKQTHGVTLVPIGGTPLLENNGDQANITGSVRKERGRWLATVTVLTPAVQRHGRGESDRSGEDAIVKATFDAFDGDGKL